MLKKLKKFIEKGIEESEIDTSKPDYSIEESQAYHNGFNSCYDEIMELIVKFFSEEVEITDFGFNFITSKYDQSFTWKAEENSDDTRS